MAQSEQCQRLETPFTSAFFGQGRASIKRSTKRVMLGLLLEVGGGGRPHSFADARNAFADARHARLPPPLGVDPPGSLARPGMGVLNTMWAWDIFYPKSYRYSAPTVFLAWNFFS